MILKFAIRFDITKRGDLIGLQSLFINGDIIVASHRMVFIINRITFMKDKLFSFYKRFRFFSPRVTIFFSVVFSYFASFLLKFLLMNIFFFLLRIYLDLKYLFWLWESINEICKIFYEDDFALYSIPTGKE